LSTPNLIAVTLSVLQSSENRIQLIDNCLASTVVETLSINHPQISVVEASKLFFKFYFLFCFLVFLATLAFCMLLLYWIVISAIGE